MLKNEIRFGKREDEIKIEKLKSRANPGYFLSLSFSFLSFSFFLSLFFLIFLSPRLTSLSSSRHRQDQIRPLFAPTSSPRATPASTDVGFARKPTKMSPEARIERANRACSRPFAVVPSHRQLSQVSLDVEESPLGPNRRRSSVGEEKPAREASAHSSLLRALSSSHGHATSHLGCHS